MTMLEELNGDDTDDALIRLRQWAAAARRDPPASGLFLADDLDRIADEMAFLREAVQIAMAALRKVDELARPSGV